MFQFPGFPSRLTPGQLVFNQLGCPIRTSTDQRLFAPPRSFSQLITSFVVSESLGIRHAPLFASYSFAFFDRIARLLDSISLDFVLLLLSTMSMNFFPNPSSFNTKKGLTGIDDNPDTIWL